MEYNNLRLEITGYIARITISRPKQLNALNLDMLQELSGILDEINKLGNIRCIIVTGDGEKSFAAGADTKVMEPMDVFQAVELSAIGNNTFQKLQNMPMPVIGAINGYALGGGLELALSCDIRIASENAIFGMPEVTLGIMPGWGGTQRLPRILGYSKAAELIFTGKHINGQEALKIGLVSNIYPADELIKEAEKLAESICANAPAGIKNAKKSMNLGLQQDIKNAIETEEHCFGIVFSSEDKLEGLSAFNNRQKQPEFKNR